MTFLSRLKFRGWDRCMEKALFPLAEWFRTSKKRLSCCLKSYSTLDRQTRSPKMTKTQTPQMRHNTQCRKFSSCQRTQMNAQVRQICIPDYFLYYTSSFFSYTLLCVALLMWGALCLSDFKVVDWFRHEDIPRQGSFLSFFFFFFLKVHTSYSNILIFHLAFKDQMPTHTSQQINLRNIFLSCKRGFEYK